MNNLRKLTSNIRGFLNYNSLKTIKILKPFLLLKNQEQQPMRPFPIQLYLILSLHQMVMHMDWNFLHKRWEVGSADGLLTHSLYRENQWTVSFMKEMKNTTIAGIELIHLVLLVIILSLINGIMGDMTLDKFTNTS